MGIGGDLLGVEFGGEALLEVRDRGLLLVLLLPVRIREVEGWKGFKSRG